MELEYIDELINIVEQSAVCLYMNNILPVQESILDIVATVGEIYKELIANTLKYKEIGVEIPGDILCAQLKNLTDSIEQRDIVAMADTLEYEIKQGLLFYKEVKGIV